MNFSEQGDMLTEISFRENVVGIKEESSTTDLDLDNGKPPVSLSPVPYQSSCLATDGSSVYMVESDVSGADILSAFDSLCVDECLEPRDGVAPEIKADAFDLVGQADQPREQLDEGKDISKFDSRIGESSARRDGEAEVLVGLDKTCMQSHSLIVYTSSRRRSVRNTKSNQNNKSRKPSKCRKIANKNSVFDLSSLQILRRSRSSFARRARSSVWGNLGNLFPDIEGNNGVDINLGNEKKIRRGRGDRGKRKVNRDQAGRESTGKRCTPTGHISLKVRIGNKSCSMDNAIENFSISRKDIPELTVTMENKFVEKVPTGIVSSCERNLEKVVSSDASALSTHLEAHECSFDNPCFDTLSYFHEFRNLDEGDNLAGSAEIRCSDVGTSPDVKVINSVPDVPHCEKGLSDVQDSTIEPRACVSVTDVSVLILSPNQSKKGKKKSKIHQSDNCMLEAQVIGPVTINNDKTPVSTQDASSLSSPRSKSKKGKKKDKLCEVGNSSVESDLTGAETTNNANAPGDRVGQKVGDVSCCTDISMSGTAKSYLDGMEMKPCSGHVAASVSSNLQDCSTLIPCRKGRKHSKCSRAKGGSKGRSRVLPNEEDKASKKMGKKNRVDRKLLVDEKVAAIGGPNGVESVLQAGNQTPPDLGRNRALINGLSGPINSLHISSDEVRDQYDLQRNAWVLCDECQKWRRIPARLADQIDETNCGWTCRDNTDKNFADCSIPQEKSDSEINEELEISEASCEEDACGALLESNQDRPKASQHSSWSLIKSNLFLHRSCKTQTIDEVMVCHCKPPSDGRMGCGAKCLNRMLNIECVHGTCPCGELCSNQQFQKRKYAKLKWFRCGKKGYGLQALDDISEGRFLIEYVGEVLDVHAYEARQKEYAMNGHKHFYFMTLNGSEVIDACAKGNLGRFINHSCDPNCRTEKWMVNGEVCIGLFALRDIMKGEEVTFDYNYVRVFGAAAKKCVCDSPNCRGYIGGDLTNSEVIAQDDSDDEYAEPVMIYEDGEMKEDWNDIMSNTLVNGENEIAIESPQNIYRMKKLLSAVGESITASNTSETSPQEIVVNSAQVPETRVGEGFEVCNSFGNNSTANVVEKFNINKITGESSKGSMPAALDVEPEDLQHQMHSSLQPMDNSLQLDNNASKAMSSAHEPISASPSKSFCGTDEYKGKLKYSTVGGRRDDAKSNAVAKTNRSLSSIKKGKAKTNVLNDKAILHEDKSSAALHKPKKLPEPSLHSHFEAVEEKLNELLDPEGGISKRKDASRGYLTLLFLTAATGNNGHGEAIQSNRDLSMILDALLKTKSRTVLIDIINKNGLQMLHNIMKRYRKEFIKTPILRKLLKVLEYLAMREILTLEHITGGPPCPGVESFKDSILTLTEHADKQVHQTARNFRDKWIPRSLRKNCCMERDDGRTEFHHLSSHGGLVPYNHWSDRGGKSSEVINSFETQSVAASCAAETFILSDSVGSCGANEPKMRKRKSRWDNPAEHPHSRTRTNLEGDEKLNVNEDIPPGFSSPCNDPMAPSDATSVTINHQEKEMRIKQPSSNGILGDPHLRFDARMPVSYGVPYSVMQQFGNHQAETSGCWTIAPGVLFHPFPPLPPRASVEVDRSTSAARCASPSAPTEKGGQCSDTCITYQTDPRHTKTCSMDPPEKNVLVTNGRPDFQQGGSCSLGRKYFRQQKWNHSKLAPPWVRMRNGWGFAGNNARNGLPGVGLANGSNDFRNSYNSDEIYRRES